MGAIYAAIRLARCNALKQTSVDDAGAVVVFGFPYLDTLKMAGRREWSPCGVEFFGNGDDRDLEKLEDLLQSSKRKVCAVGKRILNSIHTYILNNLFYLS